MRYSTGFSIVLFASALPAAAHAANCETYVGQTLTPQTFAAAVAKVAGLPAKAKGETAAQYEARKGAALASAAGPLVIAKAPEGQKYFEYDAQRQTLGIVEYAFHNKYFNEKKAFAAAGYADTVKTSTNFIAVIEQIEKTVAPAPVEKSSGAKHLGKLQLTSKVIFERPAPYNENDWVTHLFPAAAPKPHHVGELPMTPAEATALTPKLKLAYVVEPKAPYFLAGRLKYRATPHLDEVDIVEDFQILVADFQCGLVLADGGKVLGAFPTE